MRIRALRKIYLAIVITAMGTVAFSAGMNVDRFELLTHGEMSDGLFTMSSRVYFDLSFEGGNKFAGLLRMNFLSSDIEDALSLATKDATSTNYLDKLDNLTSMGFKTAAVTARRLFGLPLEATYFIGYLDSVCSGDDFVTLFGATPFSTALRGPMVYPNGIKNNSHLYYDSLDAIYGTGLSLGLLGTSSALYLYTYQDADLGAGNWTVNLRGLMDAGRLKLELFGGASYAPATPYGLYRGGLLFNYAPGKVGEFFAQIGMTRWDPSTTLGIDNFFFLFEPRINFYPGSLAITVFYHPKYYREALTGEEQSFDLNVNLKFGDVSRTGAQGGATSLFSFRPKTSETLTIDVAPYYSVITSGVEWNFKLDLKLFPFPSPWYGIFRPYIGVSTSF